MLGVVLVALAALGLPLAFLSVRLVADDAHAELQREAEVVAYSVENSVLAGTVDAQALEALTPDNRRVVVVLGDGRRVSAGDGVGARPYTAMVPLVRGATLQIARDRGEVFSREMRSVLLVLVAALLAAAIGVAVAVRLARRLSDPLLALAGRAALLGAGDFQPYDERYGIPELDDVADVLDVSGSRLAQLVQRERDLVGDISHQLRSRLTAMSMRLEEIATTSDDPMSRHEGQAALEQADRLSEVIDELLAQNRDKRLGASEPIDIDEELAALRAEWEPPLRAAGRRLVVDGARGVSALATPGRLHQCLGVLVDNALVHGGGTVTVHVRQAETNVVLHVADQGPGVPAELVPEVFSRGVSGADGTGLGLGLARALVDADGGRLELRTARPATFALYLRRADVPAEPDFTGPDATGPDATGPDATGPDATGPGTTGGEPADPRSDDEPLDAADSSSSSLSSTASPPSARNTQRL